MIQNIDLNKYKDLLGEMTQIRVQSNTMNTINLTDGNVVSNGKMVKAGALARTFEKGLWGVASFSDVSDETIQKVIKQANDNAAFLASKKARDYQIKPVSAHSNNTDYSFKSESISQGEYLKALQKIDEYVKEKFPKLKSRMIYSYSHVMEKNLLTSDGVNAYSFIPRSFVFVKMTMDDQDGKPVDVRAEIGGRGEIEEHLDKLDELYPKLEEAYKHLEAKTKAVLAKAGEKTVILDTELAGILAHEAVGHTTEADLVMSGSVAGDNLGKQVASELVTLVDYAHTAFGETCPVPVYVDDEGVEAQDVTIIKDGILQGFMHDRESAAHFNVAPTGNSRAHEFSDEPLIRMRNTVITPGTSKLEDMIASIDDGYYLMSPGNGQADSTGEFMFGVNMGYEIKNGKITNAIKNTTIAGVAFELLKTVSMVSDDMSWQSYGWCGKKQAIPVGMGGPAVKCKVSLGGN